jgi:hypothetical protein
LHIGEVNAKIAYAIFQQGELPMAALDLNAKFTAPNAEDNDSRKTMIYTADNGVKYAVDLSENIGETFGFDDFTPADVGNTPTLPTKFSMRKIHGVDRTGNVKNSFAVGKASEACYSEGGSVLVARKGKAAGLLLQFTGVTGESRTFPRSYDTGQQSGDDT